MDYLAIVLLVLFVLVVIDVYKASIKTILKAVGAFIKSPIKAIRKFKAYRVAKKANKEQKELDDALMAAHNRQTLLNARQNENYRNDEAVKAILSKRQAKADAEAYKASKKAK